MDLPRHSVSVAGIVTNRHGQVLVIRRADNGRWEPPGGVLELGETIEEGARREVAEETGYRVTIDRLTGAYKNMNRAVVALVFRCSLVDEQPHDTDDEATAVHWADPATVANLLHPAYAVRITDALSDGPPATRAHNGTHLTGA